MPNAMNILYLPTELFQIILYHAIVVRGIKRGLRLRLVNKLFARTVIETLYDFRLLDTLFNKAGNMIHPLPPIRAVISVDFVQSYLERRVTQEPPNGNPLLNCIREVATEIHKRRNVCSSELSTIKACIQKLCSICVRTRSGVRHYRVIFQGAGNLTRDEYDAHLLGAALCTNTFSIFRQYASLNEKILSPTCDSTDNCLTWDQRTLPSRFDSTGTCLFGDYMELAAKYGNEELLEYLMTSRYSTVDTEMRTKLFRIAAEAGRLETVRFLYNFRREETPWQFDDHRSTYGTNVICYTPDTSNLEVFKFIQEVHPAYPSRPKPCNTLSLNLDHSAKAGLLDMVLHLIRLGANVQGGSGYRLNEPIKNACGSGHVAVMELLLEYGADPGVTVAAAAYRGRKELVEKLLGRGIPPMHGLSQAASGGWLEVVRLLLDYGADVNESIGSDSPLAFAIGIEDTLMFNFLLDRGANLHVKETAEECVRRARKDGMESMLLLLKDHGVNIEDQA